MAQWQTGKLAALPLTLLAAPLAAEEIGPDAGGFDLAERRQASDLRIAPQANDRSPVVARVPAEVSRPVDADPLPPTAWKYRAEGQGPAISMGAGGGGMRPLRNRDVRTREGKLAHLVVKWGF